MNYFFDHPLFLLLLPLALCFIYCKKESSTLLLPRLSRIKKSAKRDINTILKVSIWILSVFALSSIYLYDSVTPPDREGRAIVLALDSSGSMRESGFDANDNSKTKFQTLLELSNEFIDKKKRDNFGIVVFGTFAFTASPVTYDLNGLKEILNTLEVEIAGKNTAIGDAINESIKTLNSSIAKEKIILLITDGMNNSGSVSPKSAVQKAKEKNIKIFTIGIGDKKNFDAKLLAMISNQTDAKSFKAKDAKELEGIFDSIDSLLPSKIRSERFINKKPLFLLPLLLSVLLLFWLLAREERVV
jgi:Ca-activated chloride channel family protein